MWHVDREVRVTTNDCENERDNERKYKDEHNARTDYHGTLN